jgi:small-conductance mechanosensitive channel
MNAIDIIKNGFKMLFLADETIQVSTNDGKNLIVFGTELATGQKVLIVDEAGVQTELPDGDYQLTSGQTITVKSSMIETITETPAPEAETEVEIEMATETETPEVEVKAGLEERIAKIEEDNLKIMEILNQILEASTEMKKQTQELSNQNVELSKQNEELNLKLKSEPSGSKPEIKPILAGNGKSGIDMEEVLENLKKRQTKI